MKPRLIVRVGLDAVRAEQQGRGEAPPWTRRLERASDRPLELTIAELLDGAPTVSNGLITVEVEPPMVQIRRLDSLPPVRSAALSALVAHQASTFFRKNGHPLVTGATWLAASHGSPRQALMAAVDLEVAEALVAGAAKAGFGIERIVIADLPAASALDLQPPAARAALRHARHRSLARLGGIVAGLWLVLGLIWVARTGLEARHIHLELVRLARARTVLVEGQAVRRRAEEMVQTLSGSAPSRHKLQDQLLGVTAALPDSAYLVGLVLDTLGTGLVTGGAHRATEVVAALERSHAGTNPRLDGGVGPDPLGGVHWERFTIRLGPVQP